METTNLIVAALIDIGQAIADVNNPRIMYDYEKQVWIKDGKYQDCAHPESIHCTCYGREHAGETAIITSHCH